MYIPDTSDLVAWISAQFAQSTCVVYEQINPKDAFGQMMMKNLAKRGCPLLGIHDDKQAQERRFLERGFQVGGFV